MATVFWGAQDVIHIDYLENGKPMTSQHYLELLDRFHVPRVYSSCDGKNPSISQ